MTEVEEKPGKKPRRRMRAAYTKITEQMEFYFSDASLHKDRFLKKSIEASSDGYISLDTFLQFKKIKALTDSREVIADALEKKSQLLQINQQRTHVRRTTPIKEPVNVDERTVYVECIPTHVDHDWVRKLFSACGKVVYVSLPRYPSTGDLKGFAFVEFETIEAAQNACEELNNPPAGLHKFGAFPKSSHQIEALKKKVPEEQFKEKMKEITAPVVDAPSDGTTSETPVQTCAGETKVQTDSESTKLKSPPPGKETRGKRRRTHSESESDQPGNTSDASPTKRKKSDVSFEAPSETEDKTQTTGKKKSRKRKSRSKTEESEDSNKEEADVVKSAPEKKQKLSEGTDSKAVENVTESTKSAESKETTDKENSSNKKKRFRKKKTKKDNEFPELRVMSKKEWVELRKEYLKLQKTSMALLKKTLSGKKGNADQNVDSKKKHKEIEFIPDVIVKVTSDKPMCRKALKTSLGDGYQIAYIDVKDEQTAGFIRCKDAESAKRINEATCAGYTFHNVIGDAEKQYWDKLISDRETKLNSKGPHKKRGQQKWMNKAQKVSIENTEKRHIVFDDD